MPRAAQIHSLIENLRRIFDTLYVTKQISRAKRLQLNQIFRSRELFQYLATHLYGPNREVVIPMEPNAKLVLLSVREIGGRQSDLLVFQRATRHRPKRRTTRCLVGHRFTAPIEETFRYNLRQLFELFDVEEDYSGFDGAAVDIINDLREKILTYDFCLFDNRETTNPSKPNVYIEAGMAFALRRRFIFCHYKKEIWPVDFANLSYISYKNYKELFQKLSALLPIFLDGKVKR